MKLIQTALHRHSIRASLGQPIWKLDSALGGNYFTAKSPGAEAEVQTGPTRPCRSSPLPLTLPERAQHRAEVL